MEVFRELNIFNKLITEKQKSKKKKKQNVFCSFRIIKWFLGIYFDEYNELPNAKIKKNGAQLWSW